MLIKSQDGKRVCNFRNFLEIYEHTRRDKPSIFYIRHIENFTDSEGWITCNLGCYDTEKRAKEIIDEIIIEWHYTNHFSNSGATGCECQGCDYGIYEMPEK